MGKDPEARYLEGGVSVVSFPLATSETFNKEGRKVEQTEWHNIVMWRGLADVAAKYLQKGKLVYIEGKLRTRQFEDKEGIKKYTTEVVAENFTLLGRKTDFEPDIKPRPPLKAEGILEGKNNGQDGPDGGEDNEFNYLA